MFRTTILLALLTALLVWVGSILGGHQGAVIAFVIAAAMNFLQLLVQRQDRHQNVSRPRNHAAG